MPSKQIGVRLTSGVLAELKKFAEDLEVGFEKATGLKRAFSLADAARLLIVDGLGQRGGTRGSRRREDDQ